MIRRGLLTLLFCTSAKADTINWGSEFGSINLQSDGASPVTAGFTIQLGKFNSGFDPDGANVDLWAANWVVFDELLPGEHNADLGYYTGEAQLLDNATFQPGDQAYVWMFNDQIVVPGSEWLLYTNDATDGTGGDDWLFPAVSGSLQTPPLSWRVSNATRTVFGGLDSDGSGPDSGNSGAGYGTSPTNPFHLQTFTFVPEPGVAVLGMAVALFLAGSRRRPRA
jgi:hypothetical protein